MLFALNERNQSLVLQFRALYSVYQADPCSYGRYYAEGVATLVSNQERLNELAIRVRGLIDLLSANPGRPQVIVKEYLAVVGQLGGVPPELQREASNLAISDSRRTANAWIDAAKATEAAEAADDETEGGSAP